MKYTILIVLFLAVSCKNEKKETIFAETENPILEKSELDVFDFGEFEPYLNKKDDKIYVINFWATWCAPCVKELPFYEKLNEAYGKENVEVILVSLDFPRQYESKLKPFIAEKKLKSKVLALNDINTNYWIPMVSQDWTGAIPATLIYNKDKRQFYEKSFDYQELETQVKQFLK